jgi:DNA-binding response OmpR family regulator
VLINAGLETFQVFTIQEASNHLELNSFDVLIADVRVPDGSGIDLVRKYRSRLTQGGTIVIIVTGEVRYRYLEEELGVDMYLEKPIAIQELLTLVQRLTISSKEKST